MRYHGVDVNTNRAIAEDYAPKSALQLPPAGKNVIKVNLIFFKTINRYTDDKILFLVYQNSYSKKLGWIP